MKIVINETQHKFLISELKYTDDDIRREASKYTSVPEFKKKNPTLFSTARNRKMLDDLFPDRQLGSGNPQKYTDDDIRREASKYTSVPEFKKNNFNMFKLAYERGMLDNLFPDRKIGGGRDVKYTDDDIRREASKYNSVPEFKEKSRNIYDAANNRKMMNDLFPDRKIGGGRVVKYTDDDIRREASKYLTDRDFKKNNFNMWQTAYNRKTLNDLFPDRRTRRGREIKYTDDEVRREASKYLTDRDFKKNNFNMFKLAYERGMLDNLFPDRKIGSGRVVKYTDDDIRREASKYTSVPEFKKNNLKIYGTANNRKMMNDLFPDRRTRRGREIKYTDDEVRREASKYNSQNEFMKGSFDIFQIAKVRKMMDDLFPDRKRGSGGHNKKPDDEIRQESSKYNSQNEFMKGNPTMFKLAYERGMLDNLFPDRKKNKYYTDDEIRREASKYKTVKDFREKIPTMFSTARNRKMLDNLFPDRKKRQNENKETLKNIIIENLKRQRLINRILDKISSQGIESLDRYERETLDNENNPNFDEKSSLISKIKYIVEKYGNIFLKGLTKYELPLYRENGEERHMVRELTDEFVKIIAIGGPDGETELAEYPVNYDELDLSTLKSIDEIINDYEYGE